MTTNIYELELDKNAANFTPLSPVSFLARSADVYPEHLAAFKVPRAVEFGELPKTSTGKIQKFELRKRAGSTTTIDV